MLRGRGSISIQPARYNPRRSGGSGYLPGSGTVTISSPGEDFGTGATGRTMTRGVPRRGRPWKRSSGPGPMLAPGEARGRGRAMRKRKIRYNYKNEDTDSDEDWTPDRGNQFFNNFNG